MNSTWTLLLLSVVGILGAFGASIGPQQRSQFPSPDTTPKVGFTFANNEITADVEGRDIKWNPTLGVLEFPTGTGNTVGVFEVAGEADNFCEIPSPKLVEDQLSQFSFVGTLAVQPRRAYILLLSGTGGSKSYLVIWVTDESYLPASLVIQHQAWLDSDNIPSGQTPTCEPVVSRIYPPVIYSQGSIIHIHGENFGVSSSEVTVNIGGYACSQQSLVVSQSVIKCAINPLGNAPGGVHAVSVTVNGKTNVPTVGAYFSGGCTLICLDNTFPDSKCEQCVSFDSTCNGGGGNGNTEAQSVTVEKLSEYFISDLVRGQKASDDNFLLVADTYKNTLLEKFPMPRYSIPEADVHISVAIQSALPRLQVVPVTQLLENFPAESLSKFEFKLVADEARWTKIQNGTETAYRLEF